MNKDTQIKGMANPNRGSVGVQEAQPHRTWVGLTDEEFWELDKEDLSLRQFVQAIDDKLKEKNV